MTVSSAAIKTFFKYFFMLSIDIKVAQCSTYNHIDSKNDNIYKLKILRGQINEH